MRAQFCYYELIANVNILHLMREGLGINLPKY